MSLLLQDKLVLSPETAKKLQQEIDDLAGATDCADVVGTKADLDSYDTSGLTDQAIIKVLQDESQNDAQTYYRYNKASDSFTLIGELGPYYTKAESDVLLNAKQDTLVNQENIKSINGDSILGSGNLEISAHLVFPSTWPTTSSTTTKQFCDVVAADTTATQGKMYLGEVRWSDLSTVGLVNAEVVVEVMDGATAQNKVIVLTMTSGNHAPYLWKYTYWNGGLNVSGWIGFQPELPSQSGNNGKFLTTNGSSLSWGDVDALPDQTGNNEKFLVTDGTNASWSTNLPEVVKSTGTLGRGYKLTRAVIGGDYIGLCVNVQQSNNDLMSWILGNNVFYSSNSFSTLGKANAKFTDVYTAKVNNGSDIFVPTIGGKMAIQVSSIPTAVASILGLAIQYMGTTDSTYTHGYFYECVSDGLDPATYSWEEIEVQPSPDPLPSQTGQSGKYLTTNGTTASWAEVDALPTQTSHSGELLTTNGTTASWNTKANLGISGVTFRTWGGAE